MKRNLITMLMLAVVSLFTACNKNQHQTAEQPTKKSLILYYSQTGATKSVAEELQRMTGADIEAIVMEEPYSGTYGQTIERVGKERAEGVLPKIKALQSDLTKYDVIYLGYPIWYGTYAMPIASLVKDNSFEGKRVVTFCTFGSGGLEAAIKDLKSALPKATVEEYGFGIRNARVLSTSKELNRFLVENGYIGGTVDVLPNYSDMQPVTEKEKAIFEAACGDYAFPLGEPIEYGVRETSEGIDYKYSVESNGTMSTIYVIVANRPDAKPEFTRVVR